MKLPDDNGHNVPPQKETVEMRMAALLEVSRRMLAAAEKEDWQTLVDLEASRRPSIRAFFEQFRVAEETGHNMAHQLRQLKALDDNILAIAKEARQNIATSIHKLAASRRAAFEYETQERQR